MLSSLYRIRGVINDVPLNLNSPPSIHFSRIGLVANIRNCCVNRLRFGCILRLAEMGVLFGAVVLSGRHHLKGLNTTCKDSVETTSGVAVALKIARISALRQLTWAVVNVRGCRSRHKMIWCNGTIMTSGLSAIFIFICR